MRLPFNGDYAQSQGFGVNPQYYKNYNVKQPDGTYASMKGHNGLDFLTPKRTPIYAPHKGKVIEALFDANGYGWYVKIENEEEGSVLAHLDQIVVSEGFQLAEGDHIGYSGNTGYVLPAPTPQSPNAGSHLHWGYYRMPRDRANGFGGFIDQTPFLYPSHQPVGSPTPVSTEVPSTDYVKQLEIDRKKFWEERDEYKLKWEQALEEVKKAKEQNGKVSDEERKMLDYYTEFKAMGYTTPQELEKALKEHEKNNNGLQIELNQTLLRNKKLAKIIGEKEEEDSTAIEMGLKAVKELDNLKRDFTAIAKTIKTKPSVMQILEVFDGLKRFKEMTEKTVVKASEEVGHPVTKEEVQKIQDDGLSFFEKIFGINFTKKGVK